LDYWFDDIGFGGANVQPAQVLQGLGHQHQDDFCVCPGGSVARALGLIASIITIMTVRGAEDEDHMAALNRGYYVATGLATVGFFLATWQMLGSYWFWFSLAGLTGIVTSPLFVQITEYYTEPRNPQVRFIAESSQTGPAHDNHLRGTGLFLFLWHLERGNRCAGASHRWTLWIGDGNYGYAGHLGLYPGHGYIRPNHRQHDHSDHGAAVHLTFSAAQEEAGSLGGLTLAEKAHEDDAYFIKNH
jgi:hypothetical protein